jgi:hypothetical protein
MLRACYREAVGNLQIKNVPADLHDKLKARAADLGMTQRDYVLQLIRRDLVRLTNQEWFDSLKKYPPHPGLDSAALVREGREEREAELDARLDERLARAQEADADRRR